MKPGGWIEVVGSGQAGLNPIRAAGSIKRQLEVAGFTEIEEKRVGTGSALGPLQKLGRFLSSVFNMNWVWSGNITISMKGAGCGGGNIPYTVPG